MPCGRFIKVINFVTLITIHNALLSISSTFEAAFEKAKELVFQWEEKEMADDKTKHSDPQISSPKPISNYLKKWFIQQQMVKIEKQD